MSAARTAAAGSVRAEEAGRRESTVLVVPSVAQGAVKGWRRLVTRHVPSGSGAFALGGEFLEPGVAYRVPVGAVVMVVDQFRGRWVVRMMCAGTGELEAVKEWELKSPLGKRVVDYVVRRLPADAGSMAAVRAEERRNRFEQKCGICRKPVPALEGLLKEYAGARWVVHRPGGCPPRPEVVRPNRRSEECRSCGRWVASGAGVAVLLEVPDLEAGVYYQAAHDGVCPADAAPGPANRVPGWCVECGEPVAPGAGYWLDERLHHQGLCPEPVAGPVWIVRRPRTEKAFEAGQVRRVRVDLRRGSRGLRHIEGDRFGGLGFIPLVNRDDNPDVPSAAAGYRVLSETYVELVAVVLDTVGGRAGRQRARVRAATPQEAAALLGGEAAEQAALAAPAAGAVCAPFTATVIGGVKPWLAEITGRDADYGLRRDFLLATVDWTNSNRAGTRGAEYAWVLRPYAVYETRYMVSNRREVREFLRVTPDGGTETITREEVELWLNTAPVWPAH